MALERSTGNCDSSSSCTAGILAIDGMAEFWTCGDCKDPYALLPRLTKLSGIGCSVGYSIMKVLLGGKEHGEWSDWSHGLILHPRVNHIPSASKPLHHD